MKRLVNARVLGNPATLERMSYALVGCAVGGRDQ